MMTVVPSGFYRINTYLSIYVYLCLRGFYVWGSLSNQYCTGTSYDKEPQGKCKVRLSLL